MDKTHSNQTASSAARLQNCIDAAELGLIFRKYISDIAQGSVNSVRPSLRQIVARALQVNASALIAAHNHPSGAAEPSESDRKLTQDLIAASRPLGLKVLDHVIVSKEATFSFADCGLLEELELLCLAPSESGRITKLPKATD